jgi:spermidine synthase
MLGKPFTASVAPPAASHRRAHFRGAWLFNDFFPADPNLVRPFVHEDERTVSLHFDMSAIQSRMRRDDPTTLELDYTRTMMGFLLFEPDPKSILMIGLGGGSLAKYCYRHLPDAQITVVEINPHVIEMRSTFFVPPDDARLRVVCDDGAAFVAGCEQCYDVVLVDGFTYDGQPEQLGSQRFYEDCRAALTETGLMVANVHVEERGPNALVDCIGDAFDGAVLTVDTEAGGNRIVFAARSADFRRRAADAQHWDALAQVHKRTLRVSSRRIARGLQSSAQESRPQASARA